MNEHNGGRIGCNHAGGICDVETARQEGRAQIANQLGEVRHHLKEMRTFLMVETPEARGTREVNDRILAFVSDLILKNERAK